MYVYLKIDLQTARDYKLFSFVDKIPRRPPRLLLKSDASMMCMRQLFLLHIFCVYFCMNSLSCILIFTVVFHTYTYCVTVQT